MKTRIKMSAIIIALCVLVIFFPNIIKFFQDSQAKKKYESISASVHITQKVPESQTQKQVFTREESSETEKTFEETQSPIDFESLKKQNPDVVGWVMIPGTGVDYPICWKEGDIEYYLHHDIDNVQTDSGSIFLDGDDKGDFTSLHNIIYGHNMKNKTMFHDITLFKDKEYFDSHSEVYVYTSEKTYRLRPLACEYTDSGPIHRQVLFDDKSEFDFYVDNMTTDCSFRQFPEGGIKQLWSFITCSYEFEDSRTVLYCYETDDDGLPVKEDIMLYSIQGTTSSGE